MAGTNGRDFNKLLKRIQDMAGSAGIRVHSLEHQRESWGRDTRVSIDFTHPFFPTAMCLQFRIHPTFWMGARSKDELIEHLTGRICSEMMGAVHRQMMAPATSVESLANDDGGD